MENGTPTAFSPLKSNKGRHLRMRKVQSFQAMIMPGKPQLKLTAYNKTKRKEKEKKNNSSTHSRFYDFHFARVISHIFFAP